MVLAQVMSIGIFLMGVGFSFIDLFTGLLLMGIIILQWLILMVWDKKDTKDWFYSWRQLKIFWMDE